MEIDNEETKLFILKLFFRAKEEGIASWTPKSRIVLPTKLVLVDEEVSLL